MKVCAYLKSFLVDGSSPDFEPCFYDPFGRWLDQDLFPKATPRTPLSYSSSPSQQKQKTIPWKTHFPHLPIFFLAFLLSSPASHQLLHCSPLSILRSLNHRHGDGHLLLHAFHAAHFLEARSSLQRPFSKCFPSGRKRPQNKWNENIYIWKPIPKEGSTNMPLFGRVYECKEYEHWSEKKVWIVSGTKWTLPKNQGDPIRDTSETRTHLDQ